MGRMTWLAVVFAALLGAMAAKPLLVQIPPVRAQNTAGEFDANRAARRLGIILADERPHPTDTPANDEVRARIVGELAAMGLSPLVRDQLACNELHKARGVTCARVRNIVVLLGPRSGKALLLSAHYDSTPTGPGAGDAGIGVATLLEVGSILRRQRLRRPVILLFNEGEELGLIGARAFLSDPLSRNVDSLVNLEARGVRGPVNMFETSRPNAGAIGVFRRAAERPFANSLSVDVYRLMPNYTDVNTFAERNWLTLNLAPIGNETRYHSPGDNLAALSRATLQHMGDQTLAIARGLDRGTPASAGNRIFMDVAGRVLVTLPLAIGVAMLVALLTGFGILALRRGGLIRSVAVATGTILGSGLLAWGALALVGAVRHGMFWRAYPLWTTLAVYSLVVLAGAVLIASIGRRSSVPQLRAGFWLVFLIIGAMIGLFAPGGIVFFLVPPLLVLAGSLASRWWKPGEAAGSAAAILFLYLTWGAMLALLEELLNSGPMWVFAPLGALLILPALIEAKPIADAAGRRGTAAIAAALTLLAWAAAIAAPAYSADRKQRFVIEHVTEAGAKTARWSVLNGGVPLPRGFGANGTWRWGQVPYTKQERWLAPAPATPGVQAPAVERLSTVKNGRERAVTIRLRPNGAQRVILTAPADAQISAAGSGTFVRPIDVTGTEGDYFVSCFGRSCDGLELQMVIGKPSRVEITVIGVRSGLPRSGAPLVAARPQLAQPQYAPDQTIAFGSVRL